jgi:hypothetical protein
MYDFRFVLGRPRGRHFAYVTTAIRHVNGNLEHSGNIRYFINHCPAGVKETAPKNFSRGRRYGPGRKHPAAITRDGIARSAAKPAPAKAGVAISAVRRCETAEDAEVRRGRTGGKNGF